MSGGIKRKCCYVVSLLLAALARAEATNDTQQDVQYFNFDPPAGTYNYGYRIAETGQFHYERRGPDNVTYGCYGYTSNSGQQPQITYYVADAQGYRVIPAHQPLLVSWNDQQMLRTELRQWTNLYFPGECADATNFHPITSAPTIPEPATTTQATPPILADPSTTNDLRATEDLCFQILETPNEYRKLAESYQYPNVHHIQCLVRCTGIIARFYSDEGGANLDRIYAKLYAGTGSSMTREQFDKQSRECLGAIPSSGEPKEVCERTYPVFACFKDQFLSALGKPAASV